MLIMYGLVILGGAIIAIVGRCDRVHREHRPE
jgi:hypothetical protein